VSSELSFDEWNPREYLHDFYRELQGAARRRPVHSRHRARSSCRHYRSWVSYSEKPMVECWVPEPESGELSVVTVVALVLGGFAAVGLAVVVASNGSHRAEPQGSSAPAQASHAPRSSAVPLPSTEVEIPAKLLYPPDSGPSSER